MIAKSFSFHKYEGRCIRSFFTIVEYIFIINTLVMEGCYLQGFDINFLHESYTTNFPTFMESLLNDSLNNGEIYNFTHFSLVMNKKLHSAIYVASNVDKSKSRDDIKRGNHWHYDNRIGIENQIGNELYANNDWDRGHLARRHDLCWGTYEEAKNANFDSFCWANISLQHAEFNQGIWKKLEDYTFDYLANNTLSQKLSIFAGPIYDEVSIEYCGEDHPLGCHLMIPSAFWKAIFYINKDKELKCASFVMKQHEFLTRGVFKGLDLLKPYQVNLKNICDETNIIFEDLLLDSYTINDIRGVDNFIPTLIQVNEDIIF